MITFWYIHLRSTQEAKNRNVVAPHNYTSMGKSKSMLIEFPSLNNILQKDVESWVAFLNCNFFQNCAPHWAIGQTIESAIWLSKVRKPLWYCRIYRLLLPCPSLQFQTSQRATMWRRSNSNSSPSLSEEEWVHLIIKFSQFSINFDTTTAVWSTWLYFQWLSRGWKETDVSC